MAEELARDYGAYMNVSLKSEMRVVHETIEEMLTRLDEFENLVSMIQSNEAICVDETLPSVLACKPRLDELCGRIDRLEQLVSRVDSDLSVVEAAVEKASQDLDGQTSGRLRTFFKPLFFKSEPAAKPVRQTPTCDIGEIFATEDFFQPTDQEKSPEK